jgi:hypothetical protein
MAEGHKYLMGQTKTVKRQSAHHMTAGMIQEEKGEKKR